MYYWCRRWIIIKDNHSRRLQLMHLLKKNCNLKPIQNATSLTCSCIFYSPSRYHFLNWLLALLRFSPKVYLKFLLNFTNLVFQIKVTNVLSTSEKFPSAVVLMIDTSIQTETKVTVNEINVTNLHWDGL